MEKKAEKLPLLTTEEAVRVPKAIEQLFGPNEQERIDSGKFLSGILFRKEKRTEAEEKLWYQLVSLTDAREFFKKEKTTAEALHEIYPSTVATLYEHAVSTRRESFQKELKDILLGKDIAREEKREELRKSKERAEISRATIDLIMGNRKEFMEAVDFLIKKTEERSAEWAKRNLAEGPISAAQQKSVDGLTFIGAIDNLRSLKHYVEEKNDPPDRHQMVQSEDFINKLCKLLEED